MPLFCIMKRDSRLKYVFKLLFYCFLTKQKGNGYMNDRFIKSVEIDWDKVAGDSYLHDIEALQQIEMLEFTKNITFFVGENGTGKSTLLEGIAVAYGFNPEGGTINYRFSTFEEVSQLSEAIHLIKGYRRAKSNYFFRAESFFNVASKTEDYRDGVSKDLYYKKFGGKSLHEQSHGESFLAYFQSFDQEGLYIMDEPEAALSPQRQLTLFIQIANMAEKGSQFLIASHSPILLGIPGAEIFSFDNGRIARCRYEETESYQVMEMFINNREYLISRLLEEPW